MGGRRARYTRRVDTFRRKIAEAIEASAAGELGVVFLLQHYEHPTALCAAIEARWPSLDWVLVTMNLVGEFSGVFESGGEGDDDNDAYAAIVDEMEDQATARQVCGEQPRAVLVCSFRHLGLSRACVGKWSVFMK
jgi:hypothetical protein